MNDTTNTDLEALHQQLIDLTTRLAREQESAETVDAVKAIGMEIAEVNHRVTLVGQLVFAEQADKLTAAVQGVQQGRAALDTAIANIQRLNAFLGAMTKFLALVDKVIDVAKLL
jgi:flagellin-like hook-associated protein FlgL